MNGKTRESKEALSKYIVDGKDQNLITLAQNEIDGIDQLEMLNPNKGIAVVNVGTLVNTPQTESSPVLSADSSLYYISFQKKTPIVLDGKDNDYFAKVYTRCV